jgi:hypothetical protein
LLKPTFELVLLASDHIKVVISQLSPLLLHLAFDLLPIALNAIPIHIGPPSSFDARQQGSVPLGSYPRRTIRPAIWLRCDPFVGTSALEAYWRDRFESRPAFELIDLDPRGDDVVSVTYRNSHRLKLSN